MIGTSEPGLACPLVFRLGIVVGPGGPTRSQTGVLVAPPELEPPEAFAAVTLNGMMVPFVATSSSLCGLVHGAAVVYVNDKVSGVVPFAAVKLVTPKPGVTTKVDGGFEMRKTTGIESEPTSGDVVKEIVAVKVPGGKLVGFTLTLRANGA